MISCYDCRLHIEYHTFIFKKCFSICAKSIHFAQGAQTHTYTHKVFTQCTHLWIISFHAFTITNLWLTQQTTEFKDAYS